MSIRVGYYRHYKGMRYRVLGTVQHSETLEAMVLYKPLYGGYGLTVRPAAMFAETIEHDGRTQPRFAFDGEADDVLGPILEQIS
ncbi:DUF1653 domain-containing protein [Luteibacter sp. PPL201]|uniref:DUF1653 domain-containing protein n=1 Tax=Luteibacter sahnii TaxID=3021977 RepID=A0ABT6B6Y0_9GAMM|nr:DUF1653 domain-containing protein [Luteibacter sp. PPL193]MDY1548202.1 DUF1653 domain-containing protein [Luteibacter sp. PPL193]